MKCTGNVDISAGLRISDKDKGLRLQNYHSFHLISKTTEEIISTISLYSVAFNELLERDHCS